VRAVAGGCGNLSQQLLARVADNHNGPFYGSIAGDRWTMKIRA
jgi:hypothetical protein